MSYGKEVEVREKFADLRCQDATPKWAGEADLQLSESTPFNINLSSLLSVPLVSFVISRIAIYVAHQSSFVLSSTIKSQSAYSCFGNTPTAAVCNTVRNIICFYSIYI